MQACRLVRLTLNKSFSISRLQQKLLVPQTWCSVVSAHRRQLSTEAAPIPSPTPEGSPKHYSPKIQQLVEDISQLTLIETADLNELLKKTLNIQDAPVMAYGGPAMASPQQEEDDAPVKREKTSFTVKLTKFEETKKVQLIKEIKNLIEGMNLVQSGCLNRDKGTMTSTRVVHKAKKFVESTPIVVKADIPKDEAEQLQAALVAAGGVAEVE